MIEQGWVGWLNGFPDIRFAIILFRVDVDKWNKKGSHEEPFLFHLFIKVIVALLFVGLYQDHHFVF